MDSILSTAHSIHGIARLVIALGTALIARFIVHIVITLMAITTHTAMDTAIATT